MSRPCEGCDAQPPVIADGPFKGSRSMHDYCAACSKDLCPKCLADGRCRESADGKHATEEP